MRYLILIIIAVTMKQLAFAQSGQMIIALDTTTYLAEANKNTWFKDTLKDTIILYKKVSVDTIINDSKLNKIDTVFFIQYYDFGWRYIGDSLVCKVSSKKQNGYYYKNQKVGYWDLSNYPKCFSEGPITPEKRYFYKGELLPISYKPTGYNNKYYFLKDSISGQINTDGTQINYLTDGLYFSCKKNNVAKYICLIKSKNGLLISKVSLKYLDEEVNLILSGKYNRDIRLSNKYNR